MENFDNGAFKIFDERRLSPNTNILRRFVLTGENVGIKDVSQKSQFDVQKLNDAEKMIVHS